MLQLERVGAGYGPVAVIHDLSLSVAAGESVALIGPNGAGKTTLIRTVTGLIARRCGRILLDGVDLARAGSHGTVALGLACVPEGRHVFTPFSVEDNLRLGALRLGGGGRARRRRFGFVYELFPRLYERRAQTAGTLSGGEQQMLAIARALMSGPRVLLLDEPFLGLAPRVIDVILTALAALRGQGLTLLLVEQKVDIALGFASRAYVLVNGRIVLEQTAAALRRRDDLDEFYFAPAPHASATRGELP